MFCVKCKANTPTKGLHHATASNGRVMAKGVCPCGCRKTRFLSGKGAASLGVRPGPVKSIAKRAPKAPAARKKGKGVVTAAGFIPDYSAAQNFNPPKARAPGGSAWGFNAMHPPKNLPARKPKPRVKRGMCPYSDSASHPVQCSGACGRFIARKNQGPGPLPETYDVSAE
jgi:hypothetical protein